MDVMKAVLSRRSETRLTGPAPDDEELLDLVQTASAAPDHGMIRPWRLVTLRGDARTALGDALALTDDDPERSRKVAANPQRAPLLVSIIFRPRVPHKVPEWEQLAAVASMVQNLQLLLHSKGWGAIWRTGPTVEAHPVRECLGVEKTEQLLGWLYVGRPLETPQAARVPRPQVDVRSRVIAFEPAAARS